MMYWALKEAEKSPELIQLCLYCKHSSCPGECSTYLMARHEIAKELEGMFKAHRERVDAESEMSALRALILGVENDGLARLAARKERTPLNPADIQAILQCRAIGATNICKLYGVRVGKRKYVIHKTMEKLLREVQTVQENREEGE